MELKNLLQSTEKKSFDKNAVGLQIHPAFFRVQNSRDTSALTKLLTENPGIQITDTLDSQLKELVKTRNPSSGLRKEALEERIHAHLGACPKWAYGVWVYYPWSGKLVHLLDEEEFLELRTNRNLYKITPEERALLATKKVGVIGLSVGQSVALTLAMERTFGELRIADFDTLELTNINRIRTGVHNLGLPKTTIVAREIAEIDPFLKVTCYNEGITADNIDDFLHKNDSLDVLIDECDSLDIKILCRQKARASGIPVLMDTSDRGMIDIERFDLEKDRPLLHGLVEEALPKSIFQDPGQRMQLSLQIAGGDQISEQMKNSLPEIGKSISTWPQLASAVMLGGAATAELTRKVLLNEKVPSGRFYLDTEEIVK